MPSKPFRVLIIVLLLSAIAAAADQQCIVSGRVTNAATGEPVKKASLHLTPSGGPGHQGYFTLSGADGNFQFSNVEPGSYTLMGDHSGFLYSVYGTKRQRWGGTILVLKPGQQLTNLAFALKAAGLIAGRVVDEDGDPVMNASVQVSKRVLANGKLTYQQQSGVNSDDRGEFRLTGLEPGKYIVLAQLNRPTNNEIPTNVSNTGTVLSYYPAALSAEDAVPIQVQSGQEVTGIELRMQSALGFHIRGVISPASAAGQLSLAVIPQGASGFSTSSGLIDHTGKFDVPNTAPGSYRILLLDEHGSTLLGSQTVRVESADVDGIVINVVQPGSISGRAWVEGTPPAGAPAWIAKTVQVALSPSEGGPVFGSAGEFSIDAEGNFVVKDISPISYEVSAFDGRNETYLKAVRFNGQDVLGKPIDLSRGVTGQLEIVFSYGAPELHGTVQPADVGSGQTATSSGGFVLMQESESDKIVNSARTDQNGGFSFKGVAPGKYRLYAFEDLGDGDGNDPEVLKALESKSTEVDLKENDNKQLQLTVISDDELQQTLVKLGLDTQ